MSYFVSKIGHLDPRFYSLIYCAIPGVQMSGSTCPTLFPKLDIWTPVSTVLYTVIPGVQMSGVPFFLYIKSGAFRWLLG